MRTAQLAPLLEQFVAVASTEHLSRAAGLLGVPQPTLSRSMARLSTELGTPLLVRDGRGVRLTRAGRMMAGHAERALAELITGVEEVRAEADPDTGRVVLGFLHSMGPGTVPRLLRDLRVQHPGVRVDLVQEGTDRLVGRVVDGTVDLALVSPAPLDQRIGHRELARQDLVTLVPVDHRWARRRRITPVELTDETLVTLRPGFGIRTLTDQLLRGSGVVPHYAFEAEDLTTMAGLVAAGLGVAVLPQGGATPPDTVELAIDDPAAVREIALIWAADRSLAPVVAQFRHFVLQHGRAALETTSASVPGRAQPRRSRKRASPSSSRSTSSEEV